MHRIARATAACAGALALAACVVVPPAAADQPTVAPTQADPTPAPAAPAPSSSPSPSAAPSPTPEPQVSIVAEGGGCGATVVEDFVWIADPATTTATFSLPSLLDGLSAPCAFTQPIPLEDYEFASESIAFVDGGAATAQTIVDRLVASGWTQDSLAASFYDGPDGSALQVQSFESWLEVFGDELAHEYAEPSRWAYVQHWQAG